MQLSDKIKKFSVEQAIDDLNRNPVKNLPKLLDRADTFCAGKFEGQRRAIRKACLDPTDAHYPMVQHILNDVDPGVRKTTLVNFFIYGISSCYTSVNWDAISSEAYFRQLIDFGACSSGISTTCRSATTPRQAGSRHGQEKVKKRQ